MKTSDKAPSIVKSDKTALQDERNVESVESSDLLESIEKVLSTLGRSCMKMTTNLNRPVNNHLIDRSAYWILVFVGENEPVRLSDLAARLGVDVSTVSRQVKTLLDAKFLTKTCDNNDKRASLLVTTKAGQRYKDEISKMRKSTIASAMQDWPLTDKKILLDLMNKLVAVLQNNCSIHLER